jgi:uncharacterized protein involved in outer membrane biogenesis
VRRVLTICAGILLALIAVALGLTVWAQSRLGPALRDQMNRDLPGQLGMPFSVGDIRVNFLAGRAEIRDLELGNPPGFSSPHLFRTTGFRADFSPLSFLGGAPRIQEIRIDGPDLTWETGPSGASNWGALLRRGKSGSEPRDSPRSESGPNPENAASVQLDRVVIADAVLRMVGTNRTVTPPPVRLPTVQLNRPGQEGGDSALTVALKLTAALAVGAQQAQAALTNGVSAAVEPVPAP